MRPRSLWPSAVLFLFIILPVCGASPSAGQADPPGTAVELLRAQLANLEALVGPIRSLERELRDGTVVAVVRKTRVDYVEPAALREGLRFDLVRAALNESGSKAGPGSIGKAGDEARISSAVAALERDIIAESNAHLANVAHDREWIEERIRLMREELERLEGGPPRQGGAAGPPPGVQGRFEPASQRVCPSPLFGKVLYGGSGPRCVGEEMTLFTGSVFGLQDEWVCAKCTPNCFFAWDAAASRLICVVTGVPTRANAARIDDPRGRWRRKNGGAASTTITGGGPGYGLTGTDGHYKHQGTITGDGATFEGGLNDVPGFCCGREGYTWIEAIDANTFRARSVWWTPGQGSKEKPQLTFGWDTWTRVAAGAAAAPPAPAERQELAARKKTMGDELNRVRIEGRWSADHHLQVGTFLGNAQTPAGLDAIDILIRDYSACYARKNTDTAGIQEAAKTGRYPTPGDRIAESDKVTTRFNQCIDSALTRWKGGPR
jgi:hypothetical protein